MSVAVVGYSASELVGLPGLPSSPRKIRERATREHWASVAVTRRGGETRLYSLASLPLAAQEALARRTVRELPTPTLVREDEVQAPASHVQRAQERARLALAVAELVSRGVALVKACATVAEGTPHSERSVRRWYDSVRRLPRVDWIARLLPQWKPTAKSADCHPDAWAFLRDDYLRQSRPALHACYRRMVDTAKAEGWSPVPSYHAVRRRLEREVSVAERVFRREGDEALAQLYPAQERDRSALRPMQAVNGDGHLGDVMVLWPDGKVERPMVIGLQDLATSKALAVRVDRSENGEVVRLAIADMIRDYGVPDDAVFDNGRVWASKEMTGGQLTRYRGRIRKEDPEGLLTSLGVTVHFTQVYHGQSKPIERMWRDFVENVSRHPAFEQAYVGSRPDRRPENFDRKKAVTLEKFIAVLMNEVRLHNARPGREAYGGKSFDEVFAEGVAASPVKRMAEWQRRLLYLSVDRVRAQSRDGAIRLFGARYWSPELVQHKGKMVSLRFDPQDLGAGVFVYASSEHDGKYICHAAAQGKVPFFSKAHARESAQAKKAYTKAVRAQAKAAQRFKPEELAALHMRATSIATPMPTSNVIAMVPSLRRPEVPVPSDEQVTVAPTAEEAARADASDRVVLELGQVSTARLIDDQQDDSLVLELGRASFAKLAGDRR